MVDKPASEPIGRNQKSGSFNELPRYARVRRVVNKRFVEFDFAIGDPSMYVELVLPMNAFATFCETNKIIMMTDDQAASVDKDKIKWRYGDTQTSGKQHEANGGDE